MTNFEKLQSMSKDELVKWLFENGKQEGGCWDEWFQKNHCDKCEAVMKYVPAFDRETEHAFCEVNGYCKYFENLNEVPSPEEIIEMWLNKEAGTDEESNGI